MAFLAARKVPESHPPRLQCIQWKQDDAEGGGKRDKCYGAPAVTDETAAAMDLETLCTPSAIAVQSAN